MDKVEKYGCEHYKRKCALIAPCCNKTYTCRVCHDDKENHELTRKKVMQVHCLTCKRVQQVQGSCEECGTKFGNYFCEICRLYDDEDKQQFHCDGCGLCRVGGRENFYHCDVCDVCLSISMKDNHKCIEKSSHSNCPVCLEDLHTSRIAAHIPPCGHLIHYKCFKDMLKTGNYACPICGQSMLDMKEVWQNVDEEVSQCPMPEEYQNYYVQILCKDCHEESRVLFHVLGLKCQQCGSYNTCRTQEPEGAEESECTPPGVNASTTQGTTETSNDQTESNPSTSSNNAARGSNLTELVNDLEISGAHAGNFTGFLNFLG
uniref:RING finger and CHY zinc finger domain-containing protein 1 n=1 Tax=Magallana gigas TaxID=29159 RepID=A0A8W8N2T0_MAGGI